MSNYGTSEINTALIYCTHLVNRIHKIIACLNYPLTKLTVSDRQTNKQTQTNRQPTERQAARQTRQTARQKQSFLEKVQKLIKY